MCQDGSFITDNISFYADAKTGTELTAEADWKRRGLYIGPQVGVFDRPSRSSCSRIHPGRFAPSEQFDTLDVTVQEEFEKFLQERGINESLAAFIPEFAEFKEQKVRVRVPRHEIT